MAVQAPIESSSRNVVLCDGVTQTSCRGVWIDGYDPEEEFEDISEGITLAYNHVKADLAEHPVSSDLYWDVYDWDIFFNTAGPGHIPFTYSSAGSSDPDVADFQGVLTHELGHGLALNDIARSACFSGGAIITMCGDIESGVETTLQRTLTSDDTFGANTTC